MKTKLLLVTAIALLLAACGKDSGSKSGTRVNRYSGNIAGQGTTTCSANSWGRIYNNNTNEADFRQTVANFTFYSLDEIGMISPYYNSNTGIEFQMTLTFNGGQLNPQASTAGFKITDSYVGQPSNNGSTVLPIQFVLRGAQGQGANGQFNAVLGDDKGTVRFQGYRTTSQGQQILYGQVYFTNAGQGEQYLGEFVVGSCALAGI